MSESKLNPTRIGQLQQFLREVSSDEPYVDPVRQKDRAAIYRPYLENVGPHDNVFGMGLGWHELLPDLLDRTDGKVVLSLCQDEDFEMVRKMGLPDRVRIWNGTNFRFFENTDINIGLMFGCLTQSTAGRYDIKSSIDRVEAVCTPEAKIYTIDFFLKKEDMSDFVYVTFQDEAVREDFFYFAENYIKGGSAGITGAEGMSAICTTYALKEFYARYFGGPKNFREHPSWEFSEVISQAYVKNNDVEKSYRNYFKKLKFESRTVSEVPDLFGNLEGIKVEDIKDRKPIDMAMVEEVVWSKSPNSTSATPEEKKKAATALAAMVKNRRKD